MAAKLHEAGKTGVIWGELYSGFWAGANSTNPWWHNMVALLTETASAGLASTGSRSDPIPMGRRRLGEHRVPRSCGAAIHACCGHRPTCRLG